MAEEVTPAQADAALARAEESMARMARSRLRWTQLGKLVMAGLFALVTLLWGFVEPLALRAVLTACAVALVPAWALIWGRSDRTVGRRGKPRVLWDVNASWLLLVSVIFVGDAVEVNGRDMSGRPWYWIPATLL